MKDGMQLLIGDDGKATLYDDTYDITIHCESEEEQAAVIEMLKELKPNKKLTNGDLMDIFRERFPELHPIDFRPPADEYAEEKKGLTVWLDNGDIILWFPKEDEE